MWRISILKGLHFLLYLGDILPYWALYSFFFFFRIPPNPTLHIVSKTIIIDSPSLKVQREKSKRKQEKNIQGLSRPHVLTSLLVSDRVASTKTLRLTAGESWLY